MRVPTVSGMERIYRTRATFESGLWPPADCPSTSNTFLPCPPVTGPRDRRRIESGRRIRGHMGIDSTVRTMPTMLPVGSLRRTRAMEAARRNREPGPAGEPSAELFGFLTRAGFPRLHVSVSGL